MVCKWDVFFVLFKAHHERCSRGSENNTRATPRWAERKLNCQFIRKLAVAISETGQPYLVSPSHYTPPPHLHAIIYLIYDCLAGKHTTLTQYWFNFGSGALVQRQRVLWMVTFFANISLHIFLPCKSSTPASKSCGPDVGLMLCQRCKCWTDVRPKFGTIHFLLLTCFSF